MTTAGGAHFWQKCQLNSLVCNAPQDNLPRRYFADSHTRKETSRGFYWHESVQVDLDGDGLLDIVTTSTNSTNRAEARDAGLEEFNVEWYRATTAGVFEYHLIVGGTLGPNDDDGAGGVFIKMHDIDRDGDQDIALTQFFIDPREGTPSVVWLENVIAPSASNNYNGTWLKHTIDSTIGLGYHMEFVDIDGDNDIELVVGNHNNQLDDRAKDDSGNVVRPPGLYYFEIPNDPASSSQWPRHVITEDMEVTLGGSPAGQGVPGIFNVGDLNGDGRLDVALPGDGNAEVYGLIQQPNGSWVQEVIQPESDGEKQWGMAIVTDIDGDGSNEIVTAQHNSIAGAEDEHFQNTPQNDPDSFHFPPGQLVIFKRDNP